VRRYALRYARSYAVTLVFDRPEPGFGESRVRALVGRCAAEWRGYPVSSPAASMILPTVS
jgi:hypothetical protein